MCRRFKLRVRVWRRMTISARSRRFMPADMVETMRRSEPRRENNPMCSRFVLDTAGPGATVALVCTLGSEFRVKQGETQ